MLSHPIGSMPVENPHTSKQTQMIFSKTADKVTLWEQLPEEVIDFRAIHKAELENQLFPISRYNLDPCPSPDEIALYSDFSSGLFRAVNDILNSLKIPMELTQSRGPPVLTSPLTLPFDHKH